MKKTLEPIVFFGSGPVAAQSLELLAKNFEIEAVITKPQPPHHREPFPVLVVAKKLGLKIFTPNGRNELSQLFTNQPVNSKVGVIIDYGFIVNQDVIGYFPLGIVNSHFSLLPRWRGADPISFAILNGDTETGVSLMLIVPEMDKGPLLATTSTVAITPSTTTPSLTEELIKLSDTALGRVLPLYIKAQVKPLAQDTSIQPTYSRKLTKEDGIIDWRKPAAQIEREIRAFIEWPKSRTTIAGKDVIITKAHTVPFNDPNAKPGDIDIIGNVLMIECGSGYLCIDKLKPAGKHEMTAEAFIAGHKHLLQ